MYRWILLLHVLGATVWTGGHLILTFVVLPRALRAGDPKLLTEFEERYERLGIPALITQVATGLWLAHHYLPDPALWFSTESTLQSHVLAKLVLLAITVGLAAHARLRLIPRLSPETLRLLAWHVYAVTAVSVLFVVVGVGVRVGGFLPS